MNFRKGQRVCLIAWKEGTPYLRFGTVTKTTSRTYYVDGAKKPSQRWFAKAKDAFEDDYKVLFRESVLPFKGYRLPPGWTVEDTVVCVCRLRRLERRLIRRSKP